MMWINVGNSTKAWTCAKAWPRAKAWQPVGGILAGLVQTLRSQAPGLQLGLQDAIAINERSHPYDGIQEIEEDGTAVFVPESVEIMRRELGYDCSRLAPDDAPQRGRELATRFEEYAARHGVDLDAVA